MSSARLTEPGWRRILPPGYAAGWAFASYLLVAAVVWLSLQPRMVGPDFSNSDKLGHVLAYATLAAWFMGFHAPARHWRVAALLLVLGAALEVGQATMRLGRTGEFADLLANLTGIALGTALSVATWGWPRRLERWLGRA